ncbi:MAG: methionine--tRNA ligase subunit beta [Bacteroidota bacterium]
MQTLMEISSYGNTYLQEQSPWKLWKTDPDSQEVKNCLNNCLQIAYLLSIISQPFIPFTATKLRELLRLPELQNGDLQKALDQLASPGLLLPEGHQVGTPQLLFAKINDRKDQSRLAIVEAQKAELEKIQAAEAASQRPPLKKEISFEDFSKLDIRTGTITAAEKIKKADKLLKLTVDLGFEVRTVVSGIAKYYSPEDVIGQEVLLLANLAPRKLRGVESQGMILMAEDGEGALAFVSPKAGWGNGWTVA